MEYKDEHYCVVCCHTIFGLMNYVVHRKNGCQPEKKIQVTSPPYINNLTETFQQSSGAEKIHVTSPPYVCNDSYQEYKQEPHQVDGYINNVTETFQQTSGAENCPSVMTNTVISETKEGHHYSASSALDLSGQNDNLIPNETKPCPVNSSNYMHEVDPKVENELKTDEETVGSSADCGYLGVQLSNPIDCPTSSAVALPVARDNGLLSVRVNEGQDKIFDVPDATRKGKKRKQHKIEPKSKISKVALGVADAGKPVDDMVGQRTDRTRGDDGDDNEPLTNVIKCEQQSGGAEADDIAGVDDTGENGIENGKKHPGDSSHGDCADENDGKSMSATEGNTSFSYNLECSQCDWKFESRSSLLEHLFTIIKDETSKNIHEVLALKYLSYFSHRSPFQCGVCKFYYTRLDDFQCHLKSADHISTAGNILTELRCRPCNITFPTLENLKQHFLNFVHNESEDIVHVVTVNQKDEKESLDEQSVNSLTYENTGQSASTENSEMITKLSDALYKEPGSVIDPPDDNAGTEMKVDPDDDMEAYMGNETYDLGEKYEVDTNSVRFDAEFTDFTKSRKRNGGKTSKTNQKKKTLQCKHCWFTCDGDADMKFHYLDQHIELTHKCDLCDIVFLTTGTYGKHIHSKEHQRNIENLGPNQSSQEFFQCHVCKKKFTSENYCKFHTALHHFHLKSEECLLQQPSITRDKYGDYLASIAKELGKTRCKCPECGLMVSKASMMAHLRQHTGEQPFQCKLCVQSFINMTSLRRHLGVHFNIFSKSCETCGQQFKRLAHYNEHLQFHKAVEIESKSHVCEVCGTSFYLAKALRAHLYKHQEKSLKCDQPGCQWSFHNKHDLKMHKLTHSSNENAFICATCGFTAKCKKYLRAHEKIHAKDIPLLECQFCEYKARKNTHMRRHMRIHLGSKPYKCPYCSYACNTHDNIRKHILETNIHVGMKVYPCKFCEYSTNSTKDFRSHLMSDHPDLVEDGARAKSLSSFTGLFIESEDLSVPEEGMQILPVVRRKNSRRSFKSDMEKTD